MKPSHSIPTQLRLNGMALTAFLWDMWICSLSLTPGMGQPGPFSVDVSYEVVEEMPGRIVVIDPLPVFDGIGHIASVEVILSP